MNDRKLRARDLGIPFSGEPGPFNAITDVAGVAVGYETLWHGEGRLEQGKGPVRTGVTAIHPRGIDDGRPCFAASFALNASGEMTGLTWLEERGLYDGPILITNSHGVGTVVDAATRWMRKRNRDFFWTAPIVAETYDGSFHDIDGGHVRPEHAFAALDRAIAGAPLEEGNVGGGTGMSTYEYKGGTGTASRKIGEPFGGYTVGVLVQSNYGLRRHLRIGGIKMGEALGDDLPHFRDPDLVTDEIRARHPRWFATCDDRDPNGYRPGDGSIIAIVATDAPLLPHQLRRIAKRPSLAIGRLGGVGAAGSGDIFIAFSIANPSITEKASIGTSSAVDHYANHALTPLFEATIDATEEAIVNAMVAADGAEGINRLYIPRLPHERVRELLARHNLLVG
jgi:D-aminopeptidase